MSTSSADSRRTSGSELDPYSRADVYYGDKSAATRQDARNRTFSVLIESGTAPGLEEIKAHQRRASQDEYGRKPRKFLIPVDSTLANLLSREDTDNNSQITIDDDGPKVLSVGTAGSQGYKRVDVRGTYMLSNLLQELTIAKDFGRKQIVLDEARLNENPVDRLARMIRDSFWPNLTRKIDAANIAMVAKDPKDWTADPRPRVYVPRGAPEQYEYYTKIAKAHPEIRLDVQWLAENVTPEYIRDLNSAPGLLAVAMDEKIDEHGHKTLTGKPFVVPGGRFNELYGWDSYMISLGLLANDPLDPNRNMDDQVDLAKNMVENFCFCIQHYGKILNANRSYYLGRSQPPFLTDMTLRIYDKIRHKPNSLEFLRRGILAQIKEYYNVWMAEPRLDKISGLSRYRPVGVGVPPETEPTHFTHVLEPYAAKHNLSFDAFVHAYNTGEIKEPELDEYFLHDRAVRESGHDTSYRLEKVAANLATVDLNSCLYKIELDIARTIRGSFGDRLVIPKEFQIPGMKLDVVETSAIWDRRAKKRRLAMNQLMWNDDKGMYFDYDTVKEEMTTYESATTFWAMWAGVATPRQAAAMVVKALPLLEELGGLAAGTEHSRGAVGLHRPNRQWDYPFGWAPQQLLAWTGFSRYGYDEEAQRLAYKWLFMVTKAFVDFNGVVVEKYDVTQPHDPHKVAAEYGNQGADFKGVPREGFGWVNASYTFGLSIVTAHMKRALGTMTDWATFERATQDLDVNVADQQYESSRDLGAVQSEFSQTSHHLGGLQGATGVSPHPATPVHATKHLPESHAGAHHVAAQTGQASSVTQNGQNGRSDQNGHKSE